MTSIEASSADPTNIDFIKSSAGKYDTPRYQIWIDGEAFPRYSVSAEGVVSQGNGTVPPTDGALLSAYALKAGNVAGPVAGQSNITPIRSLGILNHVGAPVLADGAFLLGDEVFDLGGQEWLCTASGSPGTWMAVGSGRVIGGPTTLTTNFIMTTAATAEDVPSMSHTFVYDGRPVIITVEGGTLSQDQTTSKLCALSIRRGSDSTDQMVGFQTLPNTGAHSHFFPIRVTSGPITAWPSDGAAFVVGTTYTVKVNLTGPASTKTRINATQTSPLRLYTITA